jgi:hypothetical protein
MTHLESEELDGDRVSAIGLDRFLGARAKPVPTSPLRNGRSVNGRIYKRLLHENIKLPQADQQFQYYLHDEGMSPRS